MPSSNVLVVGGGIGGLTTALCLHQQGIACEVFEQSNTIRELGVGINTLPHAIKELADLGLLPRLDAVGIRTHELIYTNRFGQAIWRELRGIDAGYDYPQFSIHRGHLQRVLYEAVWERIGHGHVHTGHQLVDVDQDGDSVTAHLRLRSGEVVTWRGNALIAADGIHSAVRNKLYPDEGPPKWNGTMLWRGATEYTPFLTGRSMIIAGGMEAKIVLYPISKEVATHGQTLMNWAVMIQLGDGLTPPPQREDWSRPGQLEDVLQHVEGVFHLEAFGDVPSLIRNTAEFFEYPVCDRDPLGRWSFGRITLMGDAAHPMYPVGSNGASQAILDARCLAQNMATKNSAEDAFQAYELERLPQTAEIVRLNRLGGPERVIDLVSQRAPDGFERLEDVATFEELRGIVGGYATAAGFDEDAVNRPAH